MNLDRERFEAERDQGPPPIDERYYALYRGSGIRRLGVEWFERVVSEWEGDNPGGNKNGRYRGNEP